MDETNAKPCKKLLFKDHSLSPFLQKLGHRFGKGFWRRVQDLAQAAGGKTRGQCPIFF